MGGLVLTQCSKGLLRRFAGKYCRHIQGDIGVQVGAEVFGINECVLCIEQMEDILSNSDPDCH